MTINKRKTSAQGQQKITEKGYNEWILRAKNKFKDRFDYSKVKDTFKAQKGPEVEIYCCYHSDWFSVIPYNHLRFKDGGCKLCDKITAKSNFLAREKSKFLLWFKNNCEERLEIQSDFTGMTEPLDFLCKIHGSITRQKPTILMNNRAYACSSCSREATQNSGLLKLENVRDELEIDLPDHVKITDVVFDKKNKRSKIGISCDYHGESLVSKGGLKRSYYKCPKCGDEATGYSGNRLRNLVKLGLKGRPTYLGVMEVEVFDIISLKVGVTTRTLQDRYKWHLKKILFSVQLNEIDAYILENKIHRNFKKNHDLRILKAGMRNKERWAGDTECYWRDKKDEIIDYIKSNLDIASSTNYAEEIKYYEVPNFFTRDISRKKSEANKPTPVIGIDCNTNEIVAEFPSLSDAVRAGYKNLSTIIYNKNKRMISGGLRWFRKSEYDPDNIPEIPKKNYQTTRVKCIETNVIYNSMREAEEDMLSKGIKVTSSKISLVCSGKRKTAGNLHWVYV